VTSEPSHKYKDNIFETTVAKLQVGVSTMVALPGNARQGVAETPVQVAVRAEGPTRQVTAAFLFVGCISGATCSHLLLLEYQ
jgi:hypothetical protein